MKYTWTKDGETLKASEKVILDTTGKVQIRNPTQKELGTYGCLVVNDSGFDMETSLLLHAEMPVILSSVLNMTNLEARSFSAVVGGTVMARTGANVMIECPVKGVPKPNITWLKKKDVLQINSFLVLNGSLFLRNVSYGDAGTYTCRAANALGKAEAASVLHITEHRLTENNTELLKGSRRKRVLMASGIGTNVSLVPGDPLRIEHCPILETLTAGSETLESQLAQSCRECTHYGLEDRNDGWTLFLRVVCFPVIDRRYGSFYWVCMYLHVVSMMA